MDLFFSSQEIDGQKKKESFIALAWRQDLLILKETHKILLINIEIQEMVLLASNRSPLSRAQNYLHTNIQQETQVKHLTIISGFN